MALSAEEQQRLDAIGDFLTVHKWRIVLPGIAFVIAMTAWLWYGSFQSAQSRDASAHLASLQGGIDRDDPAAVDEAFENILELGVSAHVENAGLLAGSYHFWRDDKESAARIYRSILSVTDDPGMLGLANLRLAQTLIDDGKPDEALDIVASQFYPSESTLRMLFEEVAGDAHVALGDLEQARARYSAVLQLLKPSHGPGYEALIISKLGLISQEGFDLEEAEVDA